MSSSTHHSHLKAVTPLVTPAQLCAELPGCEVVAQTVQRARQAIHRILSGEDDRMIVVVGPCSIHDVDAAFDYAQRLQALRAQLGDCLEIVMRVYFEKPRTTVGWKGLINDPNLDDSYDIDKGLHLARELLCRINVLGVPVGIEFLEILSARYLADLVAWGAIGARTVECQLHREMASGLPCPIGFKNSTSGDVKVAVDAVCTAACPHSYFAINEQGQLARVLSTGNQDCHIILRGGRQPNYDASNVAAAADQLKAAKLPVRIMVDASHANSRKNPLNQPTVIDAVAEQLESGEQQIMGVMIESHLVAGRQDLIPGQPLTYGQSITDSCIGWDSTVAVLHRLVKAKHQVRRTAMVNQS